MDFIKKILEFFARANEEHPYGQVPLEGIEGIEEEMVITVHCDHDRHVGL